MRWFSRRREEQPSRPLDTEEAPAVGGERMVFWKTKEQVDDVDYGPVWIADANDPNVRLEDPGLWLTWEEAEEFARRRELPLEDV
jgi:formylglycine-generating enzyme required for sulfatase activity